MSDNGIIKGILDLKIPTIIVVGGLFWFGGSMIKDVNVNDLTLEALFGSGMLTTGMLLSIVAFLDYRYKEQTDTMITQLQSALGTLSRTHSAIEQSTQNMLGSGELGKGKQAFAVEKDNSTPAS